MTESVSFFYHKDHLGSSSLMTDTSGSEYTYSEYYPYGSHWLQTDKADLSDPSAGVKHYFTGHEYDKETQLYYMLARYYDPELGNFMSSDPKMESIDSYQYVARLPVMLVDPSGEIVVFTKDFMESDQYTTYIEMYNESQSFRDRVDAINASKDVMVWTGKEKEEIDPNAPGFAGGVTDWWVKDKDDNRSTKDQFEKWFGEGYKAFGELIGNNPDGEKERLENTLSKEGGITYTQVAVSKYASNGFQRYFIAHELGHRRTVLTDSGEYALERVGETEAEFAALMYGKDILERDYFNQDKYTDYSTAVNAFKSETRLGLIWSAKMKQNINKIKEAIKDGTLKSMEYPEK